jgi:hypothetical protein
MAEESEARKRAAARKAKILARGNDRLARITHTARGEEGAKLYQGKSSSALPASERSERGLSRLYLSFGKMIDLRRSSLPSLQQHLLQWPPHQQRLQLKTTRLMSISHHCPSQASHGSSKNSWLHFSRCLVEWQASPCRHGIDSHRTNTSFRHGSYLCGFFSRCASLFNCEPKKQMS